MNDPQLPDAQEQQVAELLADLPAATMPVEVVERVHGALAREAALRARAVTDLSRRTPARPAAGTPRRAPRWLVAASVAAAVVAGSTAFITLRDQGGPDLATVAGPEVSSTQSDEAPAAESATGGAQDRGSVATQGGEELAAGSALPEVPAELEALVDDPAAPPGPAGCGSRLAREIGAQVVTAVVADAVGTHLVLLQEETERALWWLPSCESGSSDALGRSSVE